MKLLKILKEGETSTGIFNFCFGQNLLVFGIVILIPFSTKFEKHNCLDQWLYEDLGRNCNKPISKKIVFKLCIPTFKNLKSNFKSCWYFPKLYVWKGC